MNQFTDDEIRQMDSDSHRRKQGALEERVTELEMEVKKLNLAIAELKERHTL